MLDDHDIQQRMRKIEQLVHEVEATADPDLRAKAVELLQSLMEVHGAAFERILEILADLGAPGNVARDRFARDPLVASLLLLYGLHPVDIETRVRQALDKVRPLLRSHGGNVELLSIADGNVRLRLMGSCHGCPSSAQTLRSAIEEAIYELAPDVSDLQVEGVVSPEMPAGFVPLAVLT